MEMEWVLMSVSYRCVEFLFAPFGPAPMLRKLLELVLGQGPISRPCPIMLAFWGGMREMHQHSRIILE